VSWSAGGTRLPLSHSQYQRTCVAAQGGPANSFKGKGGKSEISVIGGLPRRVAAAPRVGLRGTASTVGRDRFTALATYGIRRRSRQSGA
jgi:hypothetical protein